MVVECAVGFAAAACAGAVTEAWLCQRVLRVEEMIICLAL